MSKDRQTILFVDDEPNVLKSLKRLFIDTDYKILTANDGEEGLMKLGEREIDLVISDYRMPQMNGVQFLHKVKELYPNTIRIILSGYADVAAIVEAINDGQVYKFLAKPWNEQELFTTIKRALEHHAVLDENSKLLNELKVANEELTELTKSLEIKVENRTRDLEIKNRALEISRKILSHLPVGVIGVDSSGMIVYINQTLGNYMNSAALNPGMIIEGAIDTELYQLMIDSISNGKMIQKTYDEEKNISVSVTPLPEGAGVITVFSYYNNESFNQADKLRTLLEVAHV